MPKKFFNIFSEKSSAPKEGEKIRAPPKITIDYREKNSLVVSELIALGFKVKFKGLKVADYVINGIAIERKTILDFISSMINHRLEKQLEELQQYEKKLLLLEGIEETELYNDESSNGIHANAIRGFLLSILLKYKIPILFTKNSEDTAKFFLVLSKKKNKEHSLNVNKKTLDKKERLQFILEGFPGIGPKTAKKLLEHFHTLKNILNTPNEKLKELIGKKSEVFRIVEESY